LKRISGRNHGALSLTYLAEAWLASGDAANAISAATEAIDEVDSTHGRSWLVRAEAYRLQGRIEAAAEDYNRAIWTADEPGIEDRAVAGLAAIDRPISEDEPEW
jgi:Tfp pilus assembly protein PilF